MTPAATNVVVQMTIPAKYICILKLQPNMCMKQDASMVLMICIIASLRYNGGPFRQEFSTLGLVVCFVRSCAQCIPEVISFCAGFAHTALLRLGILEE